jgi:hypothetical protein
MRNHDSAECSTSAAHESRLNLFSMATAMSWNFQLSETGEIPNCRKIRDLTCARPQLQVLHRAECELWASAVPHSIRYESDGLQFTAKEGRDGSPQLSKDNISSLSNISRIRIHAVPA